VDERQLTELFRDAADGGPPPSFGHADVVAASRRATARRRMATTGATALGMVVLVGSIVVGGGFLRDADSGGAGQAATAGDADAPSVMEDQHGSTLSPLVAPPSDAADRNVPEANAEQGRTASGKVVPWPGLRDDDARAGCGPVDRELADVLIGEFPATPTAASLAVPDQCPAGARSAVLPVDGGAIYLVLGPVSGDGPPDRVVTRDDGAIGYFVYTAKGNGLLVLSVPATAGGPAPYADRTQPVAEKLRQRF